MLSLGARPASVRLRAVAGMGLGTRTGARGARWMGVAAGGAGGLVWLFEAESGLPASAQHRLLPTRS